MKLAMKCVLLCLASAVVLRAHPCDDTSVSDIPPADRYVPLDVRCCPYLRKLSLFLPQFVACATWNAKPFRVCQSCYEHFRNITEVRQLLEDDAHKYNSTTCSQQILGSDQEEVVYKLLQEAISIWKTSQCNKCYDPSSQIPTDSLANFDPSQSDRILSKDTQHFANLTQQTLNCFQKEEAERGQVCTTCRTAYRSLNNFYSNLGDGPSDICMDIVESINITRQTWSITYSCLVQHKDSLSVTFILAFICLLPGILYGGAALFETQNRAEILTTKSKKRRVERPRSHSTGSPRSANATVAGSPRSNGINTVGTARSSNVHINRGFDDDNEFPRFPGIEEGLSYEQDHLDNASLTNLNSPFGSLET